MVRFESLEQMHWLWIVAALAALLVVAQRLHGRRARRLASDNLLGRILAESSAARVLVKATLVLLALIALVAAMIDPRWGTSFEEVRQRGIDVVVVVDVSRSMLAEDASPNRLDRAKRFALELVAEMHGDRVALIAGAGTASLRCPLTSDYGSFRLALEELTPLVAARGGSLLGDGVRLAVDTFVDEAEDARAVIVLSDGEDHGSYPEEAARVAFEERGVRVFTIGIGDASEGARIPVERNGERVFLTFEGQEVWSKLDDDGLRAMALAGGGAYVPAGTRDVDMGRFYDEHVAALTRRELESGVIRRYHAQYQWFAGLALALLLVEGFLGTRRGGRSSR